MTNHEPSKGAMTAAHDLLQSGYLNPAWGPQEEKKRDVARIIDRHMQTEREIPAGCSRAFAIKTPTGYECRFRDMILYAYPIYDVEEQSAKLAEQWCADFNSRLALTLRESVKELVDTLREVQNAYLMATPETVRDFDWILWNERADAILKRIKEAGDVQETE